MHSMRARLMAYSRGMPEAKALRGRFSQLSTLAELDDLAAEHLAAIEAGLTLHNEPALLS